jgi:hypothetical protein
MISQTIVNGHRALWLENEQLRVGVLPEKGGDIFEFTYKCAEHSEHVQFLMQTPWGLKPPGPRPPLDFLQNYEGGWQELFPNANDACHYHDQEIPFHGEVALEPWQFHIPGSESGESVLNLCVNCRKTPFRLDRLMRLRPSDCRLIIQETVTNLGTEPCDFVWGHHLTLGGDFIEDGCVLELPARELITPDVLYEPLTARLVPSHTGRWPMVPTREGGSVDLRRIPGPQSHSHDDVIVGGLERGYYRVVNPRLELSFALEWDVNVFPWLMFWQPYGGADLPPLTGIYGVGLEPWVSRYPLEKAVEVGQARSLAGGQSLETELVASIQPE